MDGALFDDGAGEPVGVAEPPPSTAPRKGKEPPPHRPGIGDPPTMGCTEFERLSAAKSLVDVVAEFEEGLADAHEVFRVTRGCLWTLTAGEIVRVARGLVAVLKVKGDG